MADHAEDDVLPDELEEQCTSCHKALAGIERLLKPMISVSRLQQEEKLSPLDNSSHILLLTYAVNTLFWVYLATQGINPKTHLVKRELERVQKAMQRAKFISDKQKGVQPKINTAAAKRFVRSALWEAEESGDHGKGESGHSHAGTKRKLEPDDDSPRAKRPK